MCFRGYFKNRILPDKLKRRKSKSICICDKEPVLVSNVH